jgi:hypothetical protein
MPGPAPIPAFPRRGRSHTHDATQTAIFFLSHCVQNRRPMSGLPRKGRPAALAASPGPRAQRAKSGGKAP